LFRKKKKIEPGEMADGNGGKGVQRRREKNPLLELPPWETAHYGKKSKRPKNK